MEPLRSETNWVPSVYIGLAGSGKCGNGVAGRFGKGLHCLSCPVPLLLAFRIRSHLPGWDGDGYAGKCSTIYPRAVQDEGTVCSCFYKLLHLLLTGPMTSCSVLVFTHLGNFTACSQSTSTLAGCRSVLGTDSGIINVCSACCKLCRSSHKLNSSRLAVPSTE